jgi:MraZ protein
MFLGQFEHTIDEKGRMTIPARYRELLEGGAFITQGLDNNLVVYKTADFERLSTRINQMNTMDPAARLLRRLFFSNAAQMEVDRSGRILIPQYLREAAYLQASAIVVGVGNCFEIWSPEHWAQQHSQLSDSDANAQRFMAIDLSL